MRGWGAVLLLMAAPAGAQDLAACGNLPTVADRRACIVSAREGQKWQTDRGKSAIDDSPSVVVGVDADTPHRNRFGRHEYPQLRAFCVENKTSVFIEFAGEFMTDIENYGQVTYRVDGRPARKKRFTAANDHSGLGLWNGSEAIAFLRELSGGSKLVVRATPFSESTVETTFTIANAEQALAPVRETCKWPSKPRNTTEGAAPTRGLY